MKRHDIHKDTILAPSVLATDVVMQEIKDITEERYKTLSNVLITMVTSAYRTDAVFRRRLRPCRNDVKVGELAARSARDWLSDTMKLWLKEYLKRECVSVDAVLDAVREELKRAQTKFPTWPTDPLHAMAILQEEAGELQQSVLQRVYEPEKTTVFFVRSEAVQVAAMAVRFLLSLDKYEFKPSTQHEQ